MSLISKIQSLISSANAVTGESRTDLTSAVQDLKDGYGGSTVEKGLVFSEYDSDGYPTKAEFKGTWSTIPMNFYRAIASSAGQILYKVTHLNLPEGVTTLADYSFYQTGLKTITIPSTLTSMGDQTFGSTSIESIIEIPNGVSVIPANCFNASTKIPQIIAKGNITEIKRTAFRATYACSLFDFSHCTAVPTLNDANAFERHKDNCVIRIPLALSDQTLGTGNGWESQTNWVALTNVVWQGV